MIRTCLFDMGNVLVFFSHDRMCEQLGRLCDRSAADIRTLLIESGIQWNYERGQLSGEQFRDWFQTATDCDVTMAAVNQAGSDIFCLNEPIVPILDQLKQSGMRLVLLSNTCQSHFDWIHEHFDVLSRFDDFVISCEVGAMKPEPEIYQAAIQKIGCRPEECFYTDDIPQYIAAGRAHGLQAEVYTDVPSLIRHLQALGVSALP